MDDLVEQALNIIERVYREGGDREETLAKLEQIKERVDALHEDLI